ncbi:hypothetical protein HaLaN_14754 [Haematococcus lacustris]|uniref:Uncharacterized protein n=1 Tax=Haematococcus lacustris TaxID=44745 RepID=A0A699Z9C8_HAELA|nr:hypothetical protein HaLaN_14754 [Haematococcus lacustris]
MNRLGDGVDSGQQRVVERDRATVKRDGRAAAQHSPHKRLAGRVRHDSEFSDTGNAAAAPRVATSQAGAADVPGASSGAHAAACGPGCGDAMRDTDEIGATSGGEGCRVGDEVADGSL